MKKVFKKFCAFFCSAAVALSLLCAGAVPSAAAAQSLTMRIEGQKSTIYSGEVSFNPGEDFYDILSGELRAKGIKLDAPQSKYGHYINAINGETGTYTVYWHLYVNGKSSDLGVDSLKPASGDNIVLYIGDDSKIFYPTISFSPEYPVAGQKETVFVSASSMDYSDPANPVSKAVKISGASVSIGGAFYTTGSDGSASFTIPSAGNYTMSVSKEASDTTPAIVRSGSIPVTVYTPGNTPNGGGQGGSSASSGSSSQASSAQDKVIDDAIASGASYILKSGVTDWEGALAIEAAGRAVPKSYVDLTAQRFSAGEITLPTAIEGTIIGLKAAGANPCDFEGVNLLSRLYGTKNIGKSGLNGYTYGLLAFDCGKYQIPAGSAVSRESLIDSVLSYQKAGGAFSLDKDSDADTDMTAIALTSLAPYLNTEKVKTAADTAEGYLSKAQRQDGGFIASFSTSETSESTSQVILALSSCGVNALSDTRFIKNGSTALSNLLSYKNKDGGFSHVQSGGSDLIATEQAVTALSAYRRLNSGSGVYDLCNVKAASSEQSAAKTVKNPDTGDRGLETAVCVIVPSLIALAYALRKKCSFNK